MKIKTKLTLGVGLLFVMITLLTVLSSVYINRLSKNTENILTDNYNSIVYCRKMLIALNNDIATPDAQKLFLENLEKENNTITELGEKDLLEKVATDFNLVKQNPADSTMTQLIHEDITDIMLLNMQALQRKSNVATQTSKDAIIWIAVAGTICFLIAFTLLINMPSNISDPISELSESIKEIAAHNYSKRVHFEGHSEFGELAQSFNTMAKKLEEYSNSSLARLLIEKKRVEALINNMLNPVLGLDENQKILFINKKALDITGLKSEEVIGKTAQEIALYNDLIRSLIQDIVNPGVVKNNAEKQLLKIYADGKESFFEKVIIPIMITPTAETTEKHLGDVIILQNVTQFKELDFAKTNFIANVSHEFKTPISSIRMSLQLLKNKKTGALNEDQKNLVDSINDDIMRLLKITGELLNMTQLESGSTPINTVPADIKDILKYAVSAAKATADQKQIKFEIKIPADLPNVLADKEKTAWVITNLLINAIRYADENSVIRIDATALNNKVELSVTDKGQGILPEYLNKIFDRYFRVPGTKKEGTGLGLSISKEFMEAQGGTISVKSEYGAGSTFTISLNAIG